MVQTKRVALTLVEVIVCICIVIVLIGLLLPAVRSIRAPANRMKCSNNFKQLMLGLYDYHDFHGSFPSGCISSGSAPADSLSWMVSLLPFIEQDNLYRRFKIDLEYAGNALPAETLIKEYRCPESSDKLNDFRLTSYFAMSGIGIDAASQPAEAPGNGFMGHDRETTVKSIKDGLSNTVALTETQTNFGFWARGGESNLRGFDADDLPLIGPGSPLGGHKGGVNVAFADGSILFVRTTIDPKIWASLVTIASDEKIPKEWYSK